MFIREAVSDWLGSRNYFYNTRTNTISENINDVIDYSHISFHPEGLNNYLTYGYSVFGQTPIDEVKVLEPNMRVFIDESGKIVEEHLKDPFDDLMGQLSTPSDTLDYLSYIINEYVDKFDQQIIVPTSSGFDSRLIDVMIKDNKRIHAYSYGISENQRESIETVYASKLCDILGIQWKQIELGEFHSLIDEWEQLYGISTHAHGMYQMEFYKKISGIEKTGTVISGFLGDLWAGKVRIGEINSIDDLNKLGLAHGLSACGAPCKILPDDSLKKRYFDNNKDKLKDENWRILETGRRKRVLLSYLLRVPEKYGFLSWSPFLDINAVAKIINLDWAEKNKRKWQVDYFRNRNMLIGDIGLCCNQRNCLDGQACIKNRLKPLDVKLLSSLFEKSYIEKINSSVAYLSNGHLAYSDSEEMKWYSRYMVLHPIETVMRNTQGFY